MKACGNDVNPTDDLTPLGENILAILKELRTLRNRLPQSGDRITALEERLRTEFLPKVTALCRGTKSGVAFAHVLVGAIQSELRQYREAQAAYLLADRLKPGDLSILNGLCSSATESGDLSAAKRAAKLITEIHPVEALGWRNLAMISCMTGDLKEAIAAADRAIKLDPVDMKSRMIRETCVELRRIGKSDRSQRN